MTRWDILGLGVVTVDDLLYVDRYPASDTKIEIKSSRRQGGGLTGTALVAAARSGARAAFLGVLGDDELSRYAREGLEREGVDCSPVIRRAGARPVHSTIIVDLSNGQRTILASREGVTFPSAAEIDDALIAQCRVLFVDTLPGDAVIAATEKAQAAGIPVVTDVENLGSAAAQFLVSRADHLIMGVQAGRQATGLETPAEIAAALGHPGRACSAITAGEAGCWYSERGAPVVHVPALQIRAVDTTGCGDVFHGVYAAVIARGEPVDRAVRASTVAAGLKATQPGGRDGIPDRATVDAMLGQVAG